MLPADKRTALLRRIDRTASGELAAKPLKGELSGFHSVRLADYRAIVEIDEAGGRFTIYKVAHRREVSE